MASEVMLEMDSAVLSKRIKVYRTAAGLSLRELSQLLPVSAQALSQYETGRTCPRMEVLEALADALFTSVDQFLRMPDGEMLRSVRIGHPVGQQRKTLRKARSSLVALMERGLTLEQELGGAFPSPSLPLMNEIRLIRNPEDAENLAQEVRRRWGLGTGPLPNLVSLFEARGVRIFESMDNVVDQGFRSCSAFVSFSCGSSADIPVILLNEGLWGELKRFALCHELAHMILPSPMRTVLSENVREELASWFAGALLLPASALREQLGRKRRTLSWYELAEVKKQFGISYQAITHRCRQIGLITRETYRDQLAKYKRLGWCDLPHKEHMAFDPDTESSTRLRRLTLRAVTEGVVTRHKAKILLDVEEDKLNRWLVPPVKEQGRNIVSS